MRPCSGTAYSNGEQYSSRNNASGLDVQKTLSPRINPVSAALPHKTLPNLQVIVNVGRRAAYSREPVYGNGEDVYIIRYDRARL